MTQLLADSIPSQFNGPGAVSALLLPAGQAAPVFEGPWVPLAGANSLSLELAGSISSLSVDLYGTNNPSPPPNGYTYTVGGTITNGDTITATFTNPNLPGASKAIVVPVVTADTTDTIGAKLAAAITADPDLSAAGITASDLSSVVTINFPSVYYGNGSADSAPLANFTGLAASKSGGASETVAVATLTNGTKIGNSLTALGLTAISPLPLFIKARLQTLTGSNANVTAAINAAI
jgi:hypothetical protein